MTIEEAIAEARENVANNHSTEPCVIRRLIHEIDILRQRETHAITLLGAVFECVEYAERCGGLDSVTEIKVRRALSSGPNR